jgi:hypothetical protein
MLSSNTSRHLDLYQVLVRFTDRVVFLAFERLRHNESTKGSYIDHHLTWPELPYTLHLSVTMVSWALSSSSSVSSSSCCGHARVDIRKRLIRWDRWSHTWWERVSYVVAETTRLGLYFINYVISLDRIWILSSPVDHHCAKVTQNMRSWLAIFLHSFFLFQRFSIAT